MLAAIMTTALAGTAWADEESVTFSGQGYTNGQAIESYEGTNFSITFDKGTNSNAPKYYTSGTAIRCYGSNSFTVSSNYTITTITLGFGSSDGSNEITTNVGTFSSPTWTGSANEVTFTIGGTSGNRRLASVTVEYETGGSQAPSISASNLSIAYDATEGEIEYTISNPVTGGTVSASSSSEWLMVGDDDEGIIPFICDPNDGIERTATVTLTYAYDNERTTKNVTITQAANPNIGTEETPYTVAQARAAIDAGAGTQGVYATGIVSAIPTAYDAGYKNITFNFVDATGDTDFLQAYRCGGDEAADVQVGDVVVVYGNLTKYGTTYEFAQGCELISLTHPTAAVEAPIFSPEGGVYTTPQTVSFAVAAPTMEGYTFYYTLDGTEPTTQSTLYTGPIEVSTTTTIKAIAVKGGEVSLVTTATYAILAHAGTEADPYSVADAHAAIDANAGLTDVYATGVVTEIATAWSTDHSNISFNFVDAAGDGGSFLQAYRCVSTDAADASTVAVGDIVVVKGTLKKYNDIYEFNSGCQLVSLTHSGTPADPVIVAENATIDADVTYYELMYEIQNPVDGTELTASTTASWITSCTPSQKSFDRVMIECEANETTEDRTATIVLTYGTLTKEVTLTQKGIVAPIDDYVTLPYSWAGGTSAELLAETGVTADGLGSDYAASNAPYRVKLDGTGDYIQFKTNERPGVVTIGVKMIGGANTSTITVQESADGENFTDVEELSISGIQNDVVTLETTKSFDEASRYARLYFTKGSNVGVGYISIAKYEEPRPAIYVRPDEIAATADGATGTLSITAEGITLTPNDQLYIEFHDADGGPLPAAPDWITTEITTGEAGFVVNYTIAANQGEARSTFFQVVAAEYKLFSNAVTVSQEAYTAPATGDQYELFYGDLVEGDYIIYYDGKAMSNEVANNRLQYAEVTPENDVITTDNEAIVWHIAPSGDYWTIYSPAAKAYAASNGTKNQAQMLVDADDHALWSVEAMATHVAHEFTNKANTAAGVNAILRNNGTYGFACYSSSTGGSLQLYKKVDTTPEPEYQTVTVTEAGYATFVATHDLEIPADANIQVYTVQAEETAQLLPVEGYIPSYEAVLVKAGAGEYNFPYTDQQVGPFKVNDLRFDRSDITASGQQYILANGENGVGFYKATPGTTIPAFKAFLYIQNGVKGFYGFDDDDATGINDLKDLKDSKDLIYNLAGQRIQKMQRGINIVGGKKILK